LLYENRNLAGAAVLHALNRTEAEAIRTFGLNNPVAIIPNGIDMPSRTVTLPPPGFMMADDRRVLLFLGRLHGKKGILELIAAWRHVIRAKRGIEDTWRVAVAGWDDGGHEKVLAAAIREAGLERHVILVGPLRGERKAQALGNASAFILPSHSEGMPMAVLEAWAYGIPVFMTRACNLPQAFTAGAAFEIEAHAERMASVLIDVLDQPRLLATTGAKGYTFVGNNYTWDRIITDLQRLYAWVLGGGERPDLVV
jgi:poly(glycerol-phosphate) alpha-glucosyltransferase